MSITETIVEVLNGSEGRPVNPTVLINAVLNRTNKKRHSIRARLSEMRDRYEIRLDFSGYVHTLA